MEDYKVGEEFQFGRIRLRVEKCDNPISCENCFFRGYRDKCDVITDAIGECCTVLRYDGNSVKFVKVEEDGK